MQNQG